MPHGPQRTKAEAMAISPEEVKVHVLFLSKQNAANVGSGRAPQPKRSKSISSSSASSSTAFSFPPPPPPPAAGAAVVAERRRLWKRRLRKRIWISTSLAEEHA